MSDDIKNVDNAEAPDNKLEVNANEVKIKVDELFAEKTEEAVAKLSEALDAKIKKFSFHGGSEESKAELKDVSQKLTTANFVKAMATASPRNPEAYKILDAVHADRLKTINHTDDSTGGFLVPTVFETQIQETFDTYSEFIQDADVQDYNKAGHVFNLNELSSDRVVVYYNVTEDSTGVTASTPTYTEPQIAVSDMLGSTDITLDFLEDKEVDIMADLSRQYGEQMAKVFQNELINGDTTVSGIVQKGVINLASTANYDIAATASGYTGVSFKDLEGAYAAAVSIDHFQDANRDGKFYMNESAWQAVKDNLVTDSSGGQYSYNPFTGVEYRANGRPVVTTNQLPTPATTTSNPFIVYANLNKHLKIRRKRGMTMKVNDQGTSLGGRNLNYQLGRELVVSQRIGYVYVLQAGITLIRT